MEREMLLLLALSSRRASRAVGWPWARLSRQPLGDLPVGEGWQPAAAAVPLLTPRRAPARTARVQHCKRI